MDLNLKGQVAVITGASTGIGAGTARVLASEGCNIVMNYFASKEKCEAVAKRKGWKAVFYEDNWGCVEDKKGDLIDWYILHDALS